MGIFDKIGGAIDKTSNLIDKSAKTIGKDLKRREHDKYLAGMILEKFDVKLLKNLCRYYKVGEPDPTKFKFSTGNVIKERVNKSHWIQHATDNISLVDITDYAKKHGIPLSDVIAEGERLIRERDEKYKV